jgi:cell division septal protein FtsQ
MLFKKQPPSRSELRLGNRTVNYQTTAFTPRLSLTPVLNRVQTHKIRLSGLLALAGLIWVVYSIFTTPMFFIYTAKIQGNSAVSAQEIYLASRLHNQSIFWLNQAEIEANVMVLPNIKSVEVTAHLPAKVTIAVTERNPELLWQTDDTVWWVDSEGTIVPPRGDTTGMLRIVDNDHQPLEVGYQIDPTIIKGAQRLQLLVPGLTSIQHSRAKGLIVAAGDGWPVYLGDGSEMERKLASLKIVVNQIKADDITPLYIDVRDPLRPVYKEKPVIAIQQPPPQQIRQYSPSQPISPSPRAVRPRF